MLTIVISIVMLSILLSAHELGHFLMAKRAGIKVEEFGWGLPPRIFAKRWGETEYSINLIPFGCFVKMLGEDGDAKEPRSFASAKKRWRAGVLFAGPFVNLFLAALLFAGAFMVGWPTPTATAVEIFKVAPASPAAEAGLQAGDIVITMAGTEVPNAATLKTITQNNLGSDIPMVVQRGEQEVSVNVTPRETWPADQGPLGVGIWEKATETTPVAYGFFDALAMGAQRTVDVVMMTIMVPVMVLQGQLSADLARPVGVVGIFQITSQAATATMDSGWLFPLLNIMGVLSAGLGLANLLPIPALDGGRLLFILVEFIRRKRIAPQTEGVIHLAGMALLLGLMLIMAYFDVIFPIAEVDWTP